MPETNRKKVSSDDQHYVMGALTALSWPKRHLFLDNVTLSWE